MKKHKKLTDMDKEVLAGNEPSWKAEYDYVCRKLDTVENELTQTTAAYKLSENSNYTLREQVRQAKDKLINLERIISNIHNSLGGIIKHEPHTYSHTDRDYFNI